MVMALMLAVASISVAAKGPGGGNGGGGGKPGGDTTAGNNLSYPVIWAEGVAKVLPGTPGMVPVLNGDWWYQWGTNGIDPDVTPASCAPDSDEANLTLNPDGLPFCDDGVEDSLTTPAGDPEADNPLPLAKVYLQKDADNVWQAASFIPEVPNIEPPELEKVNVDLIDWGDNLESVDWYTRSQVRTEVVLFEDTTPDIGDVESYLTPPMLEYEMRHTSGWGIDEVHGLATDLAGVPLLGPGTRATVYSHCARLTIQKLLIDRDNTDLDYLVWVSGEGWTEPEFYPGSEVPFDMDLINPHIFNGSVHEGGDGPGYYSAEINVKGRIIYGYTWNVRKLNEGAGDYRITFSFDQTCDTASLNTYFVDGVTDILLPLETEEEVTIEAEPVEGGATAILDTDLNLTYIDVRILERGGGGGGNK